MTDPNAWSEADVEALVRGTAHREGIKAPEVRWKDKGMSEATLGGRAIVLRRTILRDRAEARFVALHELGHVALAHQHPVRSALKLAAVLAGFSPVVLSPAVAWWTGASLVAGIMCGVAAMLVSVPTVVRWLYHSNEYAADLWAADRGGILTEQIVRTAYEENPVWAQQVAALLTSHPPINRRVRRVQEHLA